MTNSAKTDQKRPDQELREQLIGKFELRCVHTFEEAVALTGNGKLHTTILIVAGISLLAVWVEGLNMGYVMPSVKCEMNLTDTEQGMINGAGFVGIVLSAHFWGFMSDTWGRQKVLRFALLLGFIFSAISSVSYCAVMLMITRFCVGLFISGAQAAAISYVGEFHSSKTRSRSVALATCFMPTTTIYQGVMGILIMQSTWRFSLFGLVIGPWRVFLVSCSCICFVAFVAISFLPESPKFLLAIGKPDEALATLRRVYRINTGQPEETFPVTDIAIESLGSNLADANGFGGVMKMIWTQTQPLFCRPHLSNMLLICFLMMGLYEVAHGYGIWFPQILNYYYANADKPITLCTAVAMATSNAALPAITTTLNQTFIRTTSVENCIRAADPRTFYIFIIMGLLFVVVFMFVSFNIRRLEMRTVLTVWTFFAALSSLVFLWTKNFYLNVALSYMKVSSSSCGAFLSALCADLFPTRYKGMALCFILMFGRIGAVIGGNLIGALISGHCERIFIFNFASLIICVVITYVVMSRIKSAQDTEKMHIQTLKM